MKFADFINNLIVESQKTVADLSYGFGHGEFNGHEISVRSMDVNTNSKNMQIVKTFKVDGKKISKDKMFAMFSGQ